MTDCGTLLFSDKSLWYDYLKAIGTNDIFFTPEYHKCNEIIFKGNCECFYYSKNGKLILYPYIKRPIIGTKYYDITSVYGYSGYIGDLEIDFLREFRRIFGEYCKDNNIISEFIRYHPYYKNNIISDDEIEFIEFIQDIVVVDFFQVEKIDSLIRSEVRKKIKKAIKNDITIKKSNLSENIFTFYILYSNTMKRLNANEFYFFPLKFFFLLSKLLPDYCKLFLANYLGKEISVLFVLASDNISYNFLSGSDYSYKQLNSNDLLQYEVINWSITSGRRMHFLGGGLKGEDSIFKFKAKFSPHRLKYYVGKFVHNLKVYNFLSKTSFSKEIDAIKGWFPKYRFNEIKESKNEFEEI